MRKAKEQFSNSAIQQFSNSAIQQFSNSAIQQFSNSAIATRNFKDSFGQSGRLDAEYYQPKYDKFESHLKKYSHGCVQIKDHFKLNTETFKQEHQQGKEYNYIEIGSINTVSTEITPSTISAHKLPANAKRLLQKNDIIVSTVRTYRGGIAIVDTDKLIGSGAFTVLQENGKINKETLLVFLRLKPMLDFSLKFATGLAYPVINDNDVLNFPLPLFPEEIQSKIKTCLTQSRQLRTTAKHLLDSAKTAVEIAIEQGESSAMAFLQQQQNNLLPSCPAT